MSYLKEYFQRANLQEIRAFIQVGAEQPETDLRSYEQKLKEDCKPLYERYKSIFPDMVEYERAILEITNALSVYENVYLEIGMKIGVRLAYQLFLEDRG